MVHRWLFRSQYDVSKALSELDRSLSGGLTARELAELAQPNCLALLALLCDAGHVVSLETSGALDIAGVDPRVTIVMDLKTPSSGEQERNRWENLVHLKPADQLKFVIGDRPDYEWAVKVLAEHGLDGRCIVLFSPAWGTLEARLLAEWILADRLPVCFQVQLHKYLWGEARGH